MYDFLYSQTERPLVDARNYKLLENTTVTATNSFDIN